MTRIGKLHQQALAGRRLSFAEFEHLLAAFGFICDRQGGSHRIWKRTDVPRRLTIQPRGKDAKAYQVRQFFDIITEFGLTLDEDEG